MCVMFMISQKFGQQHFSNTAKERTAKCAAFENVQQPKIAKFSTAANISSYRGAF